MKTIEELQEKYTALREAVKNSIRHDPPHASEEPYVLVDDELPPYAYWVLEKPLMEMYAVRMEMMSLTHPKETE